MGVSTQSFMPEVFLKGKHSRARESEAGEASGHDGKR